MPLIVGLTGGIGSGKSEAARAFARLGAEIVDADRLGHEALRDPAIVGRLKALFGDWILDASGGIDRGRLAAIVFKDAEARKALEALSHPFIRQRAREITAASSAPLVILDAALLLEAGWDALCDKVVFVDAPETVRLERARQRSGWTDDAIRARERAQLPLTDKRARADHVLINGSSLDDLSRQAEGLMRQWGLAPEAASFEVEPP